MADALDSLRLMRTQERPAQVFVRGQGSWLWTATDAPSSTLPRAWR